MSDSDAALPSDATISRKLRDVVIAIHKAGNTDDLTVKRVRSKAEEELGLASGFFKTNSEWKQKSHDTIHEAVDKYCGDNAPEPESPPPKKPTKAKQATKKEKAAKDSPRGIKRKPVAPAKKPQKRSRVVDSDDESEAEASRPAPKAATPSDTDSEPPAKPVRRNTKVVAQDSDLEVTPTKLTKERKEENDANSASRSTAHDDTTNDLSESELSSLIDEEPVKKKGQKRAQQAPRKEPKSKVPKSAKAKGKTASSKTDDDPDSAEIKRLQGWLVKCGIRKVWSKELAKCVTPKEKIKHLKGMLTDAGMGGKYSNEKAARIKEQREFAKDLEEIQQGELAWGKSREEDTGSRPRRRLAQPARRAIIEDEDDDDEDDQKKEKDESDVSDQGKNDDVIDVDSE